MSGNCCCGVDITSWVALHKLANDETGDPRQTAMRFADAFEALLAVDRELIEERLETDPQANYLKPFVGVYDKAAGNAVRLLREHIAARPEADLRELALALRLAALADELLALQIYLDAPVDLVPLDDKQDKSEVVTDSVKELIKKWAGWWWVEPILQAIDEVLDIIRGGGKGKK